MKLGVAVFLIAIGLASAFVQDDGQPGCKTATEMKDVYYRNFFDSTAFWKCEELGKPAVKMYCPLGEGWLDSLRKCVVWEDWAWETPMEPPSKP